jgi:hypothetical protein
MSTSNQDYTARRFTSFDTENVSPSRFDVGYECEPPPSIRTELKRPKRARRTRLYPTGFVILMLAAGLIAWWVNHKSPAQLAAPESTPPVPIATPQPQGERLVLRATLVAPRAQLVRLPVPRAQLVRLIGKQYSATMPYGLQVLATYRGELASPDLLPTHGNRIGDAWIVQGTPWIWLFAPGATHPDWIDP